MIARASLVMLLLMPLISVSAKGAESAEFIIEMVETTLKDGRYLMDARIGYQLSEIALEALDNGVPITLDLHVELVESGTSWFWQERLVDSHIRHTIRYHSLADSYQLFEHSSQQITNFVTRSALLSVLGEISGFELVRVERLRPNITYQVRINAELDIESLPLPLRPTAYLQSAWKLSSGWSQWPLEH
ncbi:MAG: DUF4390 domain-containing protein [Candidatus Polarisedimenticolaceae bacterium]|nr:DUF4390 domain-containing protein [Candidatus Polarisedimenticolaceae bacterium]